MQKRAPRFPSILSFSSIIYPEALRDEAALDPEADSIFEEMSSGSELSQIFRELRLLTTAGTRLGGYRDGSNIIDVSYELEHQLVVLEASQSLPPNRPWEVADARQSLEPVTAICAAVHTLLYLGFREMPRASESFQAFFAMLKRDFDDKGPEILLAKWPDLGLWLMSVGMSVATTVEDTDWCRECAKKAIQRLGLRDAQECEKLMGRFAWLHALTELYASAFWDGIIEKFEQG